MSELLSTAIAPMIPVAKQLVTPTLRRAGQCCLALQFAIAISALAESTSYVEPFDLSVTNLPPNFRGHELKAIQMALEARVPRQAPNKDTFETTAQYQERLKTWQAQAPSAPLLGSIRMDGVLAFVDSCRTTYDADTQQFTMFKRIDRQDISISDSIKEGTGYAAQNAFGARVDVTERNGDTYYLRVQNIHRYPLCNTPRDRTYPSLFPNALVRKVQLDAQSAKALWGNIGTLWIVRLNQPYMRSETSEIEPSFRNPVHYMSTLHYVYASALEVWFYRKDSGEVLQRFVPKSGGAQELVGEVRGIGRALAFTPEDSLFAGYDNRLVSKVWAKWAAAYKKRMRSFGTVVISFDLLPDGRVSDVVDQGIVSDPGAVEHCLTAIETSVPFDPCPAALRDKFGASRGVTITFIYSQSLTE